MANVTVLGQDVSRAYGDLSAAAHASNHDMASELLTKVVDETEDRISRGIYFYPVQNMKLARQAFALHLMLTIHLITQVAIHCNQAHPKDGFGRLDQEALNLTIELMKQVGLAEEVPPVDTRGTA